MAQVAGIEISSGAQVAADAAAWIGYGSKAALILSLLLFVATLFVRQLPRASSLVALVVSLAGFALQYQLSTGQAEALAGRALALAGAIGALVWPIAMAWRNRELAHLADKLAGDGDKEARTMIAMRAESEPGHWSADDRKRELHAWIGRWRPGFASKEIVKAMGLGLLGLLTVIMVHKLVFAPLHEADRAMVETVIGENRAAAELLLKATDQLERATRTNSEIAHVLERVAKTMNSMGGAK
jgi:hypothetical protein